MLHCGEMKRVITCDCSFKYLGNCRVTVHCVN